MKIAIVGSREWPAKEFIFYVLDDIPWYLDEIISGGARGVDSWAEEWADKNNVAKTIFSAEWNKHGKSAGMIRNKNIVDAAEKVIAFWDGKSRGTKNSFELAKKQGKLWIVYTLEDYRKWCDSFSLIDKF